MRITGFIYGLIILVSCVETGSVNTTAESGTPAQTFGDSITSKAEVVSLLGQPLLTPEIPARRKQVMERQLEEARTNFNADPDSIDNIIWLGRRLAYLYRYNDAIEVYTEGLRKKPDSYRLLRHRGHRYISIRKFTDAINDLERAAFLIRDLDSLMTEPDGQPNRQNIPLSNTQFNIWYHLGLANYLQGDLDKAISAYKKCLEVSVNNDLYVATADWLYMTYRKTGNEEAAQALIDPVTRNMDIIENESYHKRILMYKGEILPEKLLNLDETRDPTRDIDLVTQGYGVANWYLYNGDVQTARDILERIIATSSWSAFGYIAAEVDLVNLRTGTI